MFFLQAIAFQNLHYTIAHLLYNYQLVQHEKTGGEYAYTILGRVWAYLEHLYK